MMKKLTLVLSMFAAGCSGGFERSTYFNPDSNSVDDGSSDGGEDVFRPQPRTRTGGTTDGTTTSGTTTGGTTTGGTTTGGTTATGTTGTTTGNDNDDRTTGDGGGEDNTPPALETGLGACLKNTLPLYGIAAVTPPDVNVDWSALIGGAELSSYAEWQDAADSLLRSIVEPNAGLIAYNRLRPGGDLAAHWQIVLNGLATFSPSEPDRNTAIAYWVNAYNLGMIKFVVEMNPLVNDLAQYPGFSGSIFDDFDLVPVVGGPISLNEIEYGILGLGRGGRVPPGFTAVTPPEPRLHKALVCGAVSCPKIRPFLYRGELMEQVLEENSYLFYNSDKHISVSGDSVRVSELMNWFWADFLTLAGTDSLAGLGRYVFDECRAEGVADQVRSTLAGIGRAPAGNQIIPYSWVVNGQAAGE